MATTKIKRITTNPRASLNYIMDKEKTLDHTLVSTFACDSSTATADFEMVLNDRRSRNRKVKAQHLIQSFKPGETDLNTAHEIGQRLADELLEGKFQYVLTTHADKKHIHNHIIFNHVSYKTLETFREQRNNVYKIRDISDNLCREYGLSVIEKENQKNRRIDPKYSRGKYKNSYRDQLKSDMDLAIRQSLNYQDFLQKMELLEWEIKSSKDKKYTTFKHRTNGQKRPIRMERLGAGYSKHMIEFRIDNEFVDIKKHEFKPINKEWVDNVIDLTSNDKFSKELGLRFWAVRHNNNAILKTIYRMNQLGCGNYKQMQNYISQLQELYSVDGNKIKDINSEITNLKDTLFKAQEMKNIIRLLSHAELLEGSDKEQFIQEHELDSKATNQYERYVNELLVTGNVIESEADIDALISRTQDSLESKRQQTKSILSDQQKARTFIMEMQHLSNNYDKYMNRDLKYDLDKEKVKYR